MIIAIDPGIKSLGIAITDETKTIAIPLVNEFFLEGNVREATKIIKKIVINKNVNTILMGYPLKTDGSRATILNFIDALIESINLNIKHVKLIKVDERFSTKRGIELLESKYKDKDKVKQLKDMAAAYVLLNDYLLYN